MQEGPRSDVPQVLAMMFNALMSRWDRASPMAYWTAIAHDVRAVGLSFLVAYWACRMAYDAFGFLLFYFGGYH